MKMRLFAYFILLPLLFLVAFTNIYEYLTYIAYACLPILIGLIIYAYIKTKEFYKMKKCLIFFVVGLFIGLMGTTPSQAQYYYGTNMYGMDESQAAMYDYLQYQ